MKRNDVMFILILSVILVVAWIIFTLLHNIFSSTINETLSQQIVAIKPTFDTKVIDTLKKRQQVNPEFQLSSQSAVPTSIIHLATSSAQQASSGGTTQ